MGSELSTIKRVLSDHFHAPVTPEKLSASGVGTKSVHAAKILGVFIASKSNHTLGSIAAEFGYANGKSVWNVVERAEREYAENPQFAEAAKIIADRLEIKL